MENIYDAYSKEIHGQTYFFVKKYLSFPEFNNVPDVLVGYGMHIDFDKACKIALVTDAAVKEQLKNGKLESAYQARVFNLPSRSVGMNRQAR